MGMDCDTRRLANAWMSQSGHICSSPHYSARYVAAIIQTESDPSFADRISEAMTFQDTNQPEFGRPPVSEVAISVQFVPLDNWRGPHAGLYWSRISADYPNTEVQPPLLSLVERFGVDFWQREQPIQIRLAGPNPQMRTWFIGKQPTDLVQVQRDRFVVNWRKVKGDETYPRYHAELRSRFEREWARFRAFVEEQGLGKIDVQQAELTYVNDMPQGDGWNNFGEVGRVFALWGPKGSTGFLPPVETMGFNGSFAMPDQRGRLHFTLQHLLRSTDNKEVIQLQLVARGKPNSGSDVDLLAWMDLGHDWIVRGFLDLTTAEQQAVWRRTK